MGPGVLIGRLTRLQLLGRFAPEKELARAHDERAPTLGYCLDHDGIETRRLLTRREDMEMQSRTSGCSRSWRGAMMEVEDAGTTSIGEVHADVGEVWLELEDVLEDVLAVAGDGDVREDVHCHATKTIDRRRSCTRMEALVARLLRAGAHMDGDGVLVDGVADVGDLDGARPRAATENKQRRPAGVLDDEDDERRTILEADEAGMEVENVCVGRLPEAAAGEDEVEARAMEEK